MGIKKIKIYIITYDNYADLHRNLTSLFSCHQNNLKIEVNIINNHSNFLLDKTFESKVNVLHNTLRPDFSMGHLSRNWNQSLINGFKDLNSPDCDLVIGCQDDVEWEINAFKKLKNIHKSYSFYTCSFGDAFWSSTPEAVKKIGIWDERFCGITFQEADYFVRCLKYNEKNSSINDFAHYRTLNVTESVVNRTTIGFRNHGSNKYLWSYHKHLFKTKWGDFPEERWGESYNVPDCNITNFVLYPYFEKDIDMSNKNYNTLFF